MIGSDRNIFIPSKPCKIKQKRIKNKKSNTKHLTIREEPLPFISETADSSTHNHSFIQYYQHMREQIHTLTPSTIQINFKKNSESDQLNSIHKLKNIEKMKSFVNKNINVGQAVEMMGQK